MSTGVFAFCEFDEKGFQPTLAAPDNKTKPLVLAGVGMRRKNLYVMEVDVYKVGFYVEPSVALPGKLIQVSSMMQSFISFLQIS